MIPARGGSKRIPMKNIRKFAEKPIIGWPIEEAVKSGLFNMVVVSTDDEKIAEIAKHAGAVVPFKRHTSLADDFTDTKSVIVDAIQELGFADEPSVEVCCIYPTAVFINQRLLSDGLTRLQCGKFSFVFTITSINSIAYRSFTQDQDGRVQMLFPENYSSRTQDLPKLYCDAAQFYWGKVRDWQSSTPMIGPDSFGIFIDPDSVQDIDDEQQWRHAELKFIQMRK